MEACSSWCRHFIYFPSHSIPYKATLMSSIPNECLSCHQTLLTCRWQSYVKSTGRGWRVWEEQEKQKSSSVSCLQDWCCYLLLSPGLERENMECLNSQHFLFRKKSMPSSPSGASLLPSPISLTGLTKWNLTEVTQLPFTFNCDDQGFNPNSSPGTT